MVLLTDSLGRDGGRGLSHYDGVIGCEEARGAFESYNSSLIFLVLRMDSWPAGSLETQVGLPISWLRDKDAHGTRI